MIRAVSRKKSAAVVRGLVRRDGLGGVRLVAVSRVYEAASRRLASVRPSASSREAFGNECLLIDLFRFLDGLASRRALIVGVADVAALGDAYRGSVDQWVELGVIERRAVFTLGKDGSGFELGGSAYGVDPGFLDSVLEAVQ